ncbi:MAG: putative Ig domain-containing protein, partial [Pseudomonadota bacterium]|nr:putative Ig domain-containing protein [Pseudomonadota bacterium]
EVDGEDGDFSVTLAVNNIDVSNGWLNSHSINDRTTVDMSTLSSDAGHAASLLSDGEGQFTLSIYSQLDVNHPPLFNQLNGVAVATEMSESVILDVRDEETMSEELAVTVEDALPFVVFDADSRTLTVSPKHNDAGQYSVAVDAVDPQGNAQNVSLPLNVVLTPYVWQVFEPALFEQIEVEAPVSVTALFSSLGRWPLLEDDSVEIMFTWLNRESDDVTVVFDTLPDFFVYDDDSDTLTASPLQEHVGQHVLNARLFDRFDSEQPPEEVRLTFNVLEVDDPLVVTSDGNGRVNVGDLYSYTLTVEDEETTLSQMRIDVLEAPDFVTFDRDSATLSGTPSQDDVGPNEVQMLITDRGGNRVLHKFEVSVISTDNDIERNGGAIGIWGTLMLTFAMVVMKRRRRA